MTRQGWYAVLCLHVTWLLWAGVIKGLGVMLPTLMEQFTAQTWLIGWMIAIAVGVADVTGPLAEPLESLLGTRFMVMASGLLIGSSFIAGSLTTSVAQLTIVLALGVGPGLNFASILTRAMIGRCFTTHYATANGIGHAGSPLGIIAIAPLTQLLLDTYGWRGAMLVLGGMSLHLAVCGALLQPTAETENHEDYQSVPAGEGSNSKSPNGGFFSQLTAKRKIFGISVCFKSSFWISSTIFLANGVVGNLWIIYYVDHVQQKGFSAYDAVTFTTAAGVGSLIMKVAHGPFIDRGWLNLRPAIVILTVVGSTTLLIDPWINSYWSMMASAFIYLGCYGTLISLTDLFTKELLRAELLVSAFSWMGLMNGMLALCFGFLPGWLFDKTGSYEVAFIFMGCAWILSLVALFVEWLIGRARSAERPKVNDRLLREDSAQDCHPSRIQQKKIHTAASIDCTLKAVAILPVSQGIWVLCVCQHNQVNLTSLKEKGQSSLSPA